MLALRLALKFLWRRRIPMLGLATLALLIGAMSGAAAIAVASGPQAVVNGRTAALGRNQYQIDVTNNNAGLHAALAAEPSIFPVWSSSSEFAANQRLVGGQLHLIADALPIGSIIEGRFAESDGEASVSREVARSLGIDLGDDVEAISEQDGIRRATVVGIYAIDDVRSALEVVMQVGDIRPTSNPSRYLTNLDFEPTSALAAANEAGDIQRRDLEVLVAFGNDNQVTEYQNSYRLVAAIVVVLGTIGWLTIASTFGHLAATSRSALLRLGAPTRLVRRSFGLGLLLVCTVGFTSGIVAAHAASALLQATVASVAGQYWSEVSTSWDVLGIQMLAAFAAMVSIFVVVPRWSARRPSQLGRPSRVKWTLAVTGTSTVLVLGFALSSRFDQSTPTDNLLRLVGVVAVGFALIKAIVLATHAARETTQVTSKLRAALASRSFGPAAFVLIVALTSSTGAVFLLQEVEAERSQYVGFLDGLPAGSFQIERIDLESAQAIAEQYGRRGGVAIIHQVVLDRPEMIIRVVNESTVACLERLDRQTLNDLFQCAGPTSVSEVSTEIDGAAPYENGLAEPRLLPNGSGNVGLVVANPATGEIVSMDRLAADVGPQGLGSALTGLILPPALIADWDIQESGVAAMALTSLAYTSEQVQGEMRQVVRSQVGAAVVNDDRGFQDGGRTVFAAFMTITGGTVILVSVAAWASSVVRSNRGVLAALNRLNAPKRATRPLVGLGLAAVGCAGPIGSVLAYMQTAPTRMAGQHWWQLGNGMWLIPAVSAIVAYFLAVTVVLRDRSTNVQ